ncbi:hypothetical protein RUM43_011429 [Polyplax serrata]|uniref:Uncharacterized protein n=1 Tax=Polyplax serrata TaxID=468196 RepID=A0AAN8RTK5_POLSC
MAGQQVPPDGAGKKARQLLGGLHVSPTRTSQTAGWVPVTPPQKLRWNKALGVTLWCHRSVGD